MIKITRGIATTFSFLFLATAIILLVTHIHSILYIVICSIVIFIYSIALIILAIDYYQRKEELKAPTYVKTK